jgi:hypothetical protein
MITKERIKFPSLPTKQQEKQQAVGIDLAEYWRTHPKSNSLPPELNEKLESALEIGTRSSGEILHLGSTASQSEVKVGKKAA